MRGSVMNWFTKNYHEQLMCCGRKTCLNRADFSKAWQKKKADKKGTSCKETAPSKFKISSAVFTSLEDFEALQKQFGSLKK